MNEDIRNIKKAIENNKLVIFVGAGVSANSRLPSWDELVNEFRKRLGIDSSSKLSTDDYLKVPQHYYNKRGFKEYYDVINTIFNDNYRPNNIHELIYKLSPQHIITTNYDDLLEQEQENQGLLYDVICEDIDLPYSANGRLIIKMHGDLKKRNIVLKEDDYLSYSKGHAMIETFIKALFTNHTVLFVGYSLNDYNLKLIINDVKHILSEHFQRGYIVNSSNIPISDYEENYFNNLGFNIINNDSVSKKFWIEKSYQIDNEFHRNLTGILEYICTFEEEVTDILQYYREKLYIFDKLSHIQVTDIIKLLKCKFSIISTNSIIIAPKDNNHIYHLIIKLKSIYEDMQYNLKQEDEKDKKQILNRDKENFTYICTIFNKAGINHILYNANNSALEFEFENMLCVDKDIITLGIMKFQSEESLEYSMQIDYPYKINTSPYIQRLTLAYIKYMNKKYLTSYKLLKDLSKDAYKDKEYLICYIAEYNKQQLINILKSVKDYRFFDINEDMLIMEIEDCIKNFENSNIPIKRVYELLCKSQKNNINDLKLFIFDMELIESKQNDIRNLIIKLNKAQLSSTIGNANNTVLHELKNAGHNLWKMINRNYLMIGHYVETKMCFNEYIQALLSTYINNNKPVSNDFFGFSTAYDEALKNIIFENIDIHIIIKYLKPKDFRDLVYKCSIKSIKTAMKPKELMIIFENIFSEVKKKAKCKDSMEYLCCYLSFLAHVDFEENVLKKDCCFKKIIEMLSELILEKELSIDLYESIGHFIYYQSKYLINNKYRIELASRKLLESFATKLVYRTLGKKKIKDTNLLLNSFFINVLINNLKLNFIILNNNSCFQEFTNNFEYIGNEKYQILNKLLTKIYKFLSKDYKESLRNIIEKELDKCFNANIYIEALNYSIIESNVNWENKMWELIDTLYSDALNGERSFPDPVEKYLKIMGSLKMQNMLMAPDFLNRYKGLYNIIDLLISPCTFDYKNKWDMKWINELPNDIIEQIIKLPRARYIIRNLLLQETCNNKTFDKLKRLGIL